MLWLLVILVQFQHRKFFEELKVGQATAMGEIWRTEGRTIRIFRGIKVNDSEIKWPTCPTNLPKYAEQQ